MVILDVPLEVLLGVTFAAGMYAVRNEFFIKHTQRDIRDIKDKLGCPKKKGKKV